MTPADRSLTGPPQPVRRSGGRRLGVVDVAGVGDGVVERHRGTDCVRRVERLVTDGGAAAVPRAVDVEALRRWHGATSPAAHRVGRAEQPGRTLLVAAR